MSGFWDIAKRGYVYDDKQEKLTHRYVPGVSGYFIVLFETPQAVSKVSGADQHLIATAVRVTVNDITINTAERTGIGGLKTMVATNIDLGGQTLTIGFYDTQSNVVLKTIRAWASAIRHPVYGTSMVAGTSSYKGALHIAVFSPQMQGITFGLSYYGVFPTNVPQSSLNTDVTNNSLFEFDVTFAFDVMDTLNQKAAKTIKAYLDQPNTINDARYTDQFSATSFDYKVVTDVGEGASK